MAYQDQFYTVGTVTVTNGSVSVTGAGTGWETALIVGGVFYAGGGAYPIQSVSSETELTLAIPYVGDDAAGVDYAIDRQRAAAISNIAMNDRLAQIIREISIGNIEDLNALDFVANQIIRTDAAGKLSQSDITAAALVLLKLSGAPAANQMPYFNGVEGAALTSLTQVGRNLLGAATTAGQRATLGIARPAFKAHLAANQLVYNGTTNLSFTAAPLNVGNCWSGGTFTAPEAGTYFFSMGTTIADGFAGQFILQIFVNGGVYTELVYPMNPQNVQQYYRAGTLSVVVQLAAGGTVQFKLVLDAVQGNPMMQAFRNFATGIMI